VSITPYHVPPVPHSNHCLRHQHEHLDYPPPEGRFFELPAGGPAVAQLACNMGATDFWRDSPGTTDIRTPDDDSPCPNSGTTAYHVSLFRPLFVVMADFSFPGAIEYVMRYFLLLSGLTLTFQYFL